MTAPVLLRAVLELAPLAHRGHRGGDWRSCSEPACAGASRAVRLYQARGRTEKEAELGAYATARQKEATGIEAERLRIAALPVTRAEQARLAGFSSENSWRLAFLAPRGLTGRMSGRRVAA